VATVCSSPPEGRKRWTLDLPAGQMIQLTSMKGCRARRFAGVWRTTTWSRRPVVCFEESPTQLIGEVREPIPAAHGQPERYDCKYKYNGTANLFVFLDAHKWWRHVKVTDERTARNFAGCMRDLADSHYPDADRIRVVMDAETWQLAQHRWNRDRVLRGQCLDRRIGEREVLVSEIDARLRQRNESCARIKWKSTAQKARHKLSRAYPDTAKES
jgi:hypothetical protein